MIRLARHLHDDRLHEYYLAVRGGEALDPRAAEHLGDCAACAARYAGFAAFLDGVRREAEVDADEVFTSDRLDQQQAQILRRIEHLNRSAHVITFPGPVAHHMVSASTRVAPRWLAAAAVAGLFVGVAVGGRFSVQPSARSTASRLNASPAPPGLTSAPVVLVNPPAPGVEPLDDDHFLHELELALERPRTRELLPIDAWTPNVREIGSRLR